MGLWGATDADESQPKFLTDAEKLKVFANTHGWVMEAGATEVAMITLLLIQKFWSQLVI